MTRNRTLRTTAAAGLAALLLLGASGCADPVAPGRVDATTPTYAPEAGADVTQELAAPSRASTLDPTVPDDSSLVESNELPDLSRAISSNPPTVAAGKVTRSAGGKFISSVLAPGATLIRRTCTLGAVAQDSAGDTYGVTAGHCATEGNGADMTWRTPETAMKIGSVTSTTGLSASTAAREPDFAVFTLDTPASGSLRGEFPFSGVADPGRLTTDTIVCKTGTTTGESCGYMLGTNPARGVAALPADAGDSGAPVYAMQGGSRVLVGFMGTSENANMSTFTYAAPVFADLGLTLVGS